MFLRLNKYHICDCGAVCDTGFLNLVLSMFILYLYFIRYFAFMRLLYYFADVIWPSYSRRYKCLAVISLYCQLFSNRLPVDLIILLLIDVIFLWLEYGRIIG